MKLRIDYLNKLKEPRHIFTSLEELLNDKYWNDIKIRVDINMWCYGKNKSIKI